MNSCVSNELPPPLLLLHVSSCSRPPEGVPAPRSSSTSAAGTPGARVLLPPNPAHDPDTGTLQVVTLVSPATLPHRPDPTAANPPTNAEQKSVGLGEGVDVTVLDAVAAAV